MTVSTFQGPSKRYTLVVGLDYKHLVQLSHTWPTWKLHKPNLLKAPMLAFHDGSIDEELIREHIDHPYLQVVQWQAGVTYPGTPGDKWTDPQRYKMLAGFVHVPPRFVETPYWLKIDTDTIATGHSNWIDPKWFEEPAAIVAHPWSFTKPPGQMLALDDWVAVNSSELGSLGRTEPLKLIPKPDASRLGHKRIISWCGFFHTRFSSEVSHKIERVCGEGMLPVPSQDGTHWYFAKRLDYRIVRANMKQRGWEHWSTMQNIVKRSQEVMDGRRD